MYAFVMVVHILVSLFLIIVILLQGGRGGLGEALGGAGAQSLIGGGANVVMTKLTAAVATIFMVTCLSLAVLSTARGRSVIERFPSTGGPAGLPLPLGGPDPSSVPDMPGAAVPSQALDQPVTPDVAPPHPVPQPVTPQADPATGGAASPSSEAAP
jgi:preprotein translocase subunit SecG